MQKLPAVAAAVFLSVKIFMMITLITMIIDAENI
jgi:hypothetical protein